MTQDIDVGKLAEQINDKADRDLWNTVPNVWNNTLNTSQITNCITEIPQDIKLELKDGVLTLKAGSKVYVPNGFEANGTPAVKLYAWTSSNGETFYTDTPTPTSGQDLCTSDGSTVSMADRYTISQIDSNNLSITWAGGGPIYPEPTV